MDKQTKRIYVDMTPYQDCKIVLHDGDNGFPVKDLPAADVRPVVRGKWDIEDTVLGRCCICSVCGSCPSIDYRFFPYCGADMRGKDDVGDQE